MWIRNETRYFYNYFLILEVKGFTHTALISIVAGEMVPLNSPQLISSEFSVDSPPLADQSIGWPPPFLEAVT